ncbi:glycosyltransferase family 39 protein [Daejeonella sp. H1SJ63]|uniref:ArnT family glycosyltransferase n=1 Tax=Daejeonella sp. H1SJ63 TaxID=3034145 RepID=UPI0023EB2F9A|nr:glycosyltransferase family 39 protein [Daejeonella sp. H1SJ63]
MKGLIVFLVSLILLLSNLDKPIIYILDEAKNAECAREMLVNDDFIVPFFNGQLRTDKPPLHYFFMALSYKIFGVSAFSARFFSGVFGALTILITFLFARRYISEKAAWLAALVLLSSLHFNFQMRLSVPDPYLIFFMTSSFMSFYVFMTEGAKKWLWLMYVCFGLGLLTKGPIAIALPGLIILLFLILSKQFSWKFVASMNMPLGVVIVLAVALPWYWLNYEATNGLWTEGFFLKHNLKRFSDTMEGHGGFFLLPLVMVIIGLLPLGVFCIQALFHAWKERANKALLYSLCIVLGIIVFFSFSQTKLPNYTAPAYPFIAILIAFLLAGMDGSNVSLKKVKWAYVFYTIIAFAIPAAVYFGLKADKNVHQAAGVWIWFIPIPFGSVLGWYFISKRQMSKFILSMSVSFIFSNFLFFAKAYPRVYGINPIVSSIAIVQNKPDLVYYKMMNSAYIFNMQRLVPAIYTQDSLKMYLKTHPEAAVISRKQFDEEIRSVTDLVPVFEQKDIFENPTTVIYQSGR